MSSRKRRSIASCSNCYLRKQKCDRTKPVCTLCNRRGVPDDCVYYSNNDSHTSSPTAVESQPEEIIHNPRLSVAHVARPIDKPIPPGNAFGSGLERGPWSARHEWSIYVRSLTPPTPSSRPVPSLADSFGYFQYSNSNTLALIQKLGADHHDPSSTATTREPTLSPESTDDVHRILERIPDRQILDFLVQYFRTEVNWMDHLVHIPSFYPQYQAWFALEQITTVAEVDFAILVLRLCSYTLQFLPSPFYTLDKIRGVLLAEIRTCCDETADSLESISTQTDSRGSLVRTQSLAFYALQCQMEGKTRGFWEALSRAIRVGQDAGIHCDAVSHHKGIDRVEREMRRRTYCNLFVWDSLLSRQLDRIPFIPGRMEDANWPDIRLLQPPHQRDTEGEIPSGMEPTIAEAPDPFTERLLQAKLADFWRGAGVGQRADYDMSLREDLYEVFSREYIDRLPPPFALHNPDERWDDRFPKLRLQRKLLHMAIYDSILWNFRPLLLRKPSPLPAYKSVMLSCQKRKLAAAALCALEAVTQLHALLHGCHTRLASIVVTTFESAVVLVYLAADQTFPEDCPPQHISPPDAFKSDPLQEGICKVSLTVTLQAIQGALKRLKMLAEVSSMADVAVTTLIRLMNKVAVLATEQEAPEQIHHAFSNRAARPMVLGTTRPHASSTTSLPTSQMSSISLPLATSAPGANNINPWLSETMSDMRSVDEYMSGMNEAIHATSGSGDISGTWPSFDPSQLYGPGVFGILEEA